MGARVRMLGQPNVVEQDRVLDLPAGKTSALLYYLAYRRDWVERDALLALLYPESDERRARQNLRALIARARRLVAAGEMEVQATRLRWRVETDIATFQAALAEARWSVAVDVYGGPFLEGFALPWNNAFQEWLQTVRGDLAGGWRDASLRLGTSLCDEGRYQDAEKLAERLCQSDPFDEVALRLRLAALTRDGRKAVALTVYESFAEFVAAELGVEPALATTELAETIRRGTDLDALPCGMWDRTIGAVGESLQRTLPRPAASFIGRERELTWLRERLEDAGPHLITLVGPGGMGKTALALEYGRRLEQEGVSVRFVPLETALDVQGVASLIGGAIGLTFFGRGSTEDQVIAALRRRGDVLILDNVEQIDGFSAFAHAIVESAADIKLVVTSRKRLELAVEWALEVGGLGHEEGAVGDAARLFAAAAGRADASFEPGAHRADIDRICRLVGGMPLALELAAGWLPVLDPGEIAERLEHDLEILRGDAADRPARHRALVAVLEETWSGLLPPERRALAALAVFVGGFTVQAAESVVGVSADILRSLSRGALIRRASDGRFRQHPLVWRFARSRAAEQDDWETLRVRHARYFLNVMARIAAGAATHPDEPPRALVPEFANALEAWDCTVDRGRIDLLGPTLEGLRGLAVAAGMMATGARAVDRAIRATGADDALRSRLLRVKGVLLTWCGAYDRAREPLQDGLALAERLGDRQEEGLGHFSVGLWTSLSRVPGTDVRPVLGRAWRRSLELFQEVGDRYHQARALVNLASIEGDPTQRAALLRSAIELYRSCRGSFGLTLALSSLAGTLLDTRGAYEEALDLLDEAVRIERSVGLPFRLAWWLANRADVFLDWGRFAEAERDYREAGELAATIAAGWGVWEAEHVTVGLGRLHLARGQHDLAVEAFARAATEASGHADPHGYRMRARCWKIVAQWRADRWRAAEEGALEVVRSPEWWMAVDDHQCAPDGTRVIGVLVEARVRRGEAGGARRTLAAHLPIVRKYHLLPTALELCLAGSRLYADAGPDGAEQRLLKLAARHPAAAAHTRAEALRRLAGSHDPNGADLGAPFEGMRHATPSSPTGVATLAEVLIELEASTIEA